MFNNAVANEADADAIDPDIFNNYPRNLDISYFRYMFNNKVSIISNLDVDNSGIPKTKISKLPFHPKNIKIDTKNIDLYECIRRTPSPSPSTTTPPRSNTPSLDSIEIDRGQIPPTTPNNKGLLIPPSKVLHTLEHFKRKEKEQNNIKMYFYVFYFCCFLSIIAALSTTFVIIFRQSNIANANANASANVTNALVYNNNTITFVPTSVPTTSAPTTSAPTTSAPTTSAPTTSAPVTAAPAPTEAPYTSAPTTFAPVTAAPVTAAPVTAAPVTAAPAPTTFAPAPVTAAPAPTEAPYTSAPTTFAPTSAPTNQTDIIKQIQTQMLQISQQMNVINNLLQQITL